MTQKTYTAWSRVVAQTLASEGGSAMTMQHEVLDMDRAVERLHEAMRERPDGGVRNWLDVALNGWGDE